MFDSDVTNHLNYFIYYLNTLSFKFFLHTLDFEFIIRSMLIIFINNVVLTISNLTKSVKKCRLL